MMKNKKDGKLNERKVFQNSLVLYVFFFAKKETSTTTNKWKHKNDTALNI